MGNTDNFHSLLVGWSKIILPLCALALLSTLFLFARSGSDATDIPFADIEALAQEQRINAPRFSGIADNGAIITVSAQSAQLDADAPHRMIMSSLKLDLTTAEGSDVFVTAISGEVDSQARLARLNGLARLETSTGYTMETNGLSADLKSGTIISDGALEVRAPFGAITAGRVTVQTTPDKTGQQILFTDGVQLVYTPKNGRAEDITK